MEIEVFIVIDQDGDYGVGAGDSDAREAYENDHGELSEQDGFRTYRIKLTVPLPRVVTVSGVVEDTETPATLKVE